ncbi:histidine phosphatase family protein [Fimbriiglobus ruber]|uniref:Histidine phosphatase family protein n=1 Tax=Fimbriiglobus ruber TaxID=1908690 RepID=A0A225DS69_9BACT|nr:histidine phosphatase family protein [Fimbriiglobus ruber]OWK44300.1 histidine phosphatase family protein [Fimbriiglobus ruber]
MSLPSRVWLLRHAETATPTVFHGAESDVGLSELGRQQATAGAEWFRPLAPTVVVSSGMRRAIDTAAPIAAACGVPHHIEPDLHERRVGAMCGTSFSAHAGPWAETVTRWSARDTAYTTPGAESFDDLKVRLLAAWERVTTAYPGGRVVVVAHGVVCKTLLLSVLDGWDVSGWGKLGKVANLAVSDLIPAGGVWHADGLLTVPPQVAALSAGLPTGIGNLANKSEA